MLNPHNAHNAASKALPQTLPLMTLHAEYMAHEGEAYLPQMYAMPCAIKGVQQNGVVYGYASVFNRFDTDGDAIAPGAFDVAMQSMRKGDIGARPKMLWQHDPTQPIGRWEHFRVDDYGLYVQGRLFLELQQAQEAHTLLKEGELDGLSIGFIPMETRPHNEGGQIIQSMQLMEISLVTFPANPGARVTGHKGRLASPDTAQHKAGPSVWMHHKQSRKPPSEPRRPGPYLDTTAATENDPDERAGEMEHYADAPLWHDLQCVQGLVDRLYDPEEALGLGEQHFPEHLKAAGEIGLDLEADDPLSDSE